MKEIKIKYNKNKRLYLYRAIQQSIKDEYAFYKECDRVWFNENVANKNYNKLKILNYAYRFNIYDQDEYYDIIFITKSGVLKTKKIKLYFSEWENRDDYIERFKL